MHRYHSRLNDISRRRKNSNLISRRKCLVQHGYPFRAFLTTVLVRNQLSLPIKLLLPTFVDILQGQLHVEQLSINWLFLWMPNCVLSKMQLRCFMSPSRKWEKRKIILLTLRTNRQWESYWYKSDIKYMLYKDQVGILRFFSTYRYRKTNSQARCEYLSLMSPNCQALWLDEITRSKLANRYLRRAGPPRGGGQGGQLAPGSKQVEAPSLRK